MPTDRGGEPILPSPGDGSILSPPDQRRQLAVEHVLVADVELDEAAQVGHRVEVDLDAADPRLRALAVHDLPLEVRPGETLVVLGANGAGKSTLALILAGVLAPEGGEVRRVPVAADAPPALPAGLVTQNPEDCFSTFGPARQLPILPL